MQFRCKYLNGGTMEYPNLKLCLDTSEDDIVKDLYTPCLCWANRFDRGVGYFTSGWLSNNIVGLSFYSTLLYNISVKRFCFPWRKNQVTN